jgi:hypothetical protein
MAVFSLLEAGFPDAPGQLGVAVMVPYVIVAGGTGMAG